jgi:Rrf2 family transcriptional regulator, nitric oxide-sensitive transcriptional repressor
MKLTQWTDYTVRVLMYCAGCASREQPPTIGEIADAHAISRSHLTKIVMTLSALGWLETTRGRGGGLRLLQPAHQIRLGEVIRQTETELAPVECFDAERNRCRLDGSCRLKGVLGTAMESYMAVLDSVTLADLVQPMPPVKRGKSVQRVRWMPGMPGVPASA